MVGLQVVSAQQSLVTTTGITTTEQALTQKALGLPGEGRWTDDGHVHGQSAAPPPGIQIDREMDRQTCTWSECSFTSRDTDRRMDRCAHVQSAASPPGTQRDGRMDRCAHRMQPHLQRVPRDDQCTIMFPSKGVQLQVGLSPVGYLHKREKSTQITVSSTSETC